MGSEMAASQSSGAQLKKRNNYKLLVDPEIKKGQKKVYRLNGKDEPGVRTMYLWWALFGVYPNLLSFAPKKPSLRTIFMGECHVFPLQFPPCGEPTDPRTQKTVLGLGGPSVDFKLPRFKVSLSFKTGLS